MNKIIGSQVADNGSTISKSKNKNEKNSKIIKRVRKESIIISFIVATLSAIASMYVYETFIK